MTFVLNKCYGHFGLSTFATKSLGLASDYDFNRNDSLMVDALASLICEFGSKRCSDNYAQLKVVEIPDNFTDYEIKEYDGIEIVTYVIDGKLYHA